MCSHNITNDNSNATDKDFLVSSFINQEDIDVYEFNSTKYYAKVLKEDYTNKNISDEELRVYICILGHTGYQGVCYKPRSVLMKDYTQSEPTFRRHLASLESKGFLYRKQISRHRGGSISSLVVKCKKDEYVKFLRSKNYHKTANNVEKYFKNPSAYLEEKLKNKVPSDQKRAVEVPPIRSERSNITSYIKDKELADKQTAAASFSSFDQSIKPVHGKSVSNMLSTFKDPDLPVSEKDQILNELKGLAQTTDTVLIIKLLDKYWNEYTKDSTGNVAGFIHHGIKNGYILEKLIRIERSKQQAAKIIHAENSELGNKQLAEKIKLEVDNLLRQKYPRGYKPINPECVEATVLCTPLSCLLKINICRFGEDGPITQKIYHAELFYKSATFSQEINHFRRKLDEML